MLERCSACARGCCVNRAAGELGFCRAPRNAVVNSYGPHRGEEDVLTDSYGSGTIFLGHCNLACVFCQNYEVSQQDEGWKVTAGELADIMLELQEMGCHNINLVSPSHFVPQILEALVPAVEDGLNIPIVYNTGGYDSLETLQLLDGVVDIYMPDIKFGTNEAGEKYSSAPGYFDVVQKAVREMHRQVGDLKVDEKGLAVKGLLVRHLVLPENLAGTREVMEFLAREISRDTYVNVMEQYFPSYRAGEYRELNRCPTRGEFLDALRIARESGLKRLV
ncbi:MAG: radical SAM protein [Clostridiales bacterium]|nr:radical SAM protein [Clostridiales bacterium]MCF8023044.1 radical SAM protein [Clostridiales bacterium]